MNKTSTHQPLDPIASTIGTGGRILVEHPLHRLKIINLQELLATIKRRHADRAPCTCPMTATPMNDLVAAFFSFDMTTPLVRQALCRGSMPFSVEVDITGNGG